MGALTWFHVWGWVSCCLDPAKEAGGFSLSAQPQHIAPILSLSSRGAGTQARSSPPELHTYTRTPAALLQGEGAPRGQDPALSFGVTRTRVVPSPVTLPSCTPTVFHFRTTGLGHRRRRLDVCTHVDLRRGARRERNAAPPSPSPSFIPAAYFNK